ncbi:hypothetical protein [Aquitalea pelogenes]|uniref:hypothetical protein n=1 Tax=Aquitalea pelogenes TaxID=1293573 RepID=UPI0035B04F26
MATVMAWMLILLIDLAVFFWAPISIVFSRKVTWKTKRKWLAAYLLSFLLVPWLLLQLFKLVGLMLHNPGLAFFGQQLAAPSMLLIGLVFAILFRRSVRRVTEQGSAA